INDTSIKRVIEITVKNLKGDVKEKYYIRFDSLDTIKYVGTEISDNWCFTFYKNKFYLGMALIKLVGQTPQQDNFLASFDYPIVHDSTNRIIPNLLAPIKSGAYQTKIYSIINKKNNTIVLSQFFNNTYHYTYTSITSLDSNFRQLWKKDYSFYMVTDFFPQ